MNIHRQWFIFIIYQLQSLLAASYNFGQKQLYTFNEWKYLDFDYPTKSARDYDIKTGYFNPGHHIPIDVDIYRTGYDHTVFITIPRFENNTPVTLGYVTKKKLNGNPLIAPFPNWEWNKVGNCNGVTSVFRIKVDECDRLWVVDTGKVGDEQICSPQLLTFDLKSQRFLSRYRFPKDQYSQNSLIITPAVQIQRSYFEHGCENTFVYVADTTGYAMLVYDHWRRKSWKITDKSFYPDPRYTTFNINGGKFNLSDGLFAVTLSPKMYNYDQLLFFHSLASLTERYVSTSLLKNQQLVENNPDIISRNIKVFPYGRKTQASIQDMDKRGILFFGLIGDNAIGCSNIFKPIIPGKSIEKVVVNNETLQFVSGMKIIPSSDKSQRLLVMTSPFQKYMSNTLDKSKVNFRMMFGDVDDLVRGTYCEC